MRRSLLGMRNVSDKFVQKIKTQILCSITFFFFFSEIRAVCEIMWKNIVQPDRPHMTIWRMRIACWIPKATNTHSEYVTLIAFLQQQWSQERASLLLHVHIAFLVAYHNTKSDFCHEQQ